MSDTELAIEQDHMDRAYARLERLQEHADELARSELEEHAPTPAARPERDAREAHGLRRRQTLRIPGGLIFGRIDRTDGETYRIGRIGVSDDDQTPMVIDWRAPVAEPFYRATPADPLGVVRRRHLFTRGRRVVGIEDEALDLEADHDGLVLVGEAALLDAVRERRTGRMRDIVATIQSEQDRIIRAPLGGAVVVQGGPGTGKTAVALHRAAFLLYKHRFPLVEQGVLVVGPNPLFLRYIERVLPSLGENRCRLATVTSLYDGVAAVGGHDTDAVARLKGDARMAEVVARAVATRQRPLRRKHAVPFGAFRLVIGPSSTTRIVDAVKAAAGTHNARRGVVERLVLRHLLRQYERAIDRARLAGMPADRRPLRQVKDVLAASPEVKEILERVWPRLTPEQLVSDLYAHRALLDEAAAGVLEPSEISLLERPAANPWTVSDVPLLDEARELLGPVVELAVRRPETVGDADAMVDRMLEEHLPRCRNCDTSLTYVPPDSPSMDDTDDPDRVEVGFGMGSDGPPDWRCEACDATYYSDEVLSPEQAFYVLTVWKVAHGQVMVEGDEEPPPFFATYGHVVVDEAQELSAMEWRMLARRCPSRSMTIVGDLGQGSGPSAATSWEEVISLLQPPRQTVARLTVNYRTPREVMDIADRLAPAGAGGAEPARCVRDAGVAPRFVDASTAGGDVVAVAARIVEEEHKAVPDGKVGVVAPGELAAALRVEVADGPALDADVTVVDPEAAKGLEFDAVIVVEPSAFTDRELYVALTRTTTRLAVVHDAPLPAALMSAVAPGSGHHS